MKWEILKKAVCYKAVMLLIYYGMFGLETGLVITFASFAAYFVFDWSWCWLFGWKRLGEGKIIWLTGLPCSGKTTLANAAAKKLRAQGKSVVVLDGDELRTTLCAGLGFSEEDRAENLRRVIHVANICAGSGSTVICAFVSPSLKERTSIRELAESTFTEVFVNASAAVCAVRDVKGMWAKAKAGIIKDFTGWDAKYEAPNWSAIINTAEESVEKSTKKLLKLIGG